MKNYYLFHSKTKFQPKQIKDIIAENYRDDFTFEMIEINQGFIIADEKLFDVLETLIPLINQDLGIGLTILVSHQNHRLANHVLRFLIQKGVSTCRYLGDVLMERLMDSDSQFNLFVIDEFKNIPREIILTASMFIHCGLNAIKTANKLYIHRNTFNYRLHKFIALTGLDIRDYRHALYFELASRLLKTI
jgi:hypothetical protein